MQKALRITTILLLAILLALFALWAFGGETTGPGLAAAALSALLYAVCGILFLPKLFSDYGRELPAPDAGLGRRSNRFSVRHPWAQIALAVLLSRILIYVLAYAASTLMFGYEGGIFDTLRGLWVRSDANSYIGIAERWYVTEGDPRFHIVFFPFYPLLAGGLNLILQNGFASCLVISNLSAMAAGCFAYELFALDYRRRDALRAVKFLFLLPAAFFLNAPMTESLFILLSLASLYFARKRSFLLSCILAAFAGFTRSLGALLLLPIAIEMAYWLGEKQKAGEGKPAQTVKTLLQLLIVPLGLAAYLAINYALTGDALKFMEYQREHWNQGFGFFWNSAAYQTAYLQNAVAAGDGRMALGLYLPNLLCSFGALALMIPAVKRIRPAYSAYFMAYFAVAIGATWLLSAPRYLTAAFPLALSLMLLSRRRAVNAVLTALLALLQLGYLVMFMAGYPVY